MMSCSSFPFIEKCLYCSLLYVMSIVLKPSNNITLFSLKKTSFVTRVLSVCKMVVRILSLRHLLLGELTVTLSTNMAVSKAHMASLLKSYKTKKERQAHESTLKENNGSELHVHVTRVPVDWY